jgi:hypothetical protein
LGLHDTADTPLVLYQGNGTLNDTSGNGLHLAASHGTESYTEIWPGTLALNLDGNTRLFNADAGRILQITGAVTMCCLLVNRSVELVAGSSVFIYAYDGNGEVLATNTLHSVYFDNTTANPTLGWFHEAGAGTNHVYNINSWPTPYQLCHVAVTRTAGNVVQFYLNGKALGAASGALTAAAGGTTAVLQIGSNGSTGGLLYGSFALASFALYGSALSAANILGKANQCLSPVFGEIV